MSAEEETNGTKKVTVLLLLCSSFGDNSFFDAGLSETISDKNPVKAAGYVLREDMSGPGAKTQIAAGSDFAASFGHLVDEGHPSSDMKDQNFAFLVLTYASGDTVQVDVGGSGLVRYNGQVIQTDWPKLRALFEDNLNRKTNP